MARITPKYELSFSLLGTGCGRRLGMVSGEIRDFQISYSSDTNVNTYDQGRLLLPGPGWCASVDDVKPYFQVLVNIIIVLWFCINV